jgi:tRNA(Arg) A34 adenosine deaminase TadA
MCAQAISFARIRRLYFGAYDPKGGGVEHGARVFEQATCHWKPRVTKGVSADASATLLKDFFKARR